MSIMIILILDFFFSGFIIFNNSAYENITIVQNTMCLCYDFSNFKTSGTSRGHESHVGYSFKAKILLMPMKIDTVESDQYKEITTTSRGY